MLEDSFKEKDPLKIGRFGLGFKSIFHLTGNVFYVNSSFFVVSTPGSISFA